MTSIKTYIIDCLKECKKIPSLTGVAMLGALNVIINNFKIVFGPYLELSFSTITVAISGMLYGPLLSGLAGFILDTLKFIIYPTGPYFFGFSLNEFLVGFIYGLFFYKQTITWKRVLAARLTITLIVNLTLTTLWLTLIFGQSFTAIFPLRLLKNILMLPIDTVILFIILTRLRPILLRMKKK